MTTDAAAIKDLRERAEGLRDGCYAPHCESGCACQSANLGGAACSMTVEQIMGRLPLFPKTTSKPACPSCGHPASRDCLRACDDGNVCFHRCHKRTGDDR